MRFSSGIVFLKTSLQGDAAILVLKRNSHPRTKRTLVVVLGLVPAGYNESVLVIYPGRIWPDLLDCKTCPWAVI